jgi:hypothetical protein
MNLPQVRLNDMAFEDRIEQLSRFALVLLLLATLGCIL